MGSGASKRKAAADAANAAAAEEAARLEKERERQRKEALILKPEERRPRRSRDGDPDGGKGRHQRDDRRSPGAGDKQEKGKEEQKAKQTTTKKKREEEGAPKGKDKEEAQEGEKGEGSGGDMPMVPFSSMIMIEKASQAQLQGLPQQGTCTSAHGGHHKKRHVRRISLSGLGRSGGSESSDGVSSSPSLEDMRQSPTNISNPRLHGASPGAASPNRRLRVHSPGASPGAGDQPRGHRRRASLSPGQEMPSHTRQLSVDRSRSPVGRRSPSLLPPELKSGGRSRSNSLNVDPRVVQGVSAPFFDPTKEHREAPASPSLLSSGESPARDASASPARSRSSGGRRRVSFNATVWEAEYEKGLEESISEYNAAREGGEGQGPSQEGASAQLEVHTTMLKEVQDGPALKIKEKKAKEDRKKRREERERERQALRSQMNPTKMGMASASSLSESKALSLSQKRALREAKEHSLYVGGS